MHCTGVVLVIVLWKFLSQPNPLSRLEGVTNVTSKRFLIPYYITVYVYYNDTDFNRNVNLMCNHLGSHLFTSAFSLVCSLPSHVLPQHRHAFNWLTYAMYVTMIVRGCEWFAEFVDACSRCTAFDSVFRFLSRLCMHWSPIVTCSIVVL